MFRGVKKMKNEEKKLTAEEKKALELDPEDLDKVAGGAAPFFPRVEDNDYDEDIKNRI